MSKALGDAAELRAIAHLQQHGYRILRRNYRIKGGELDVVAQDGPVLCFVEVRARKTRAFGAAEETVTPAKRRRVILAARHWLAGHPWNGACRFDVVAIHGDEITLLKDAFRVE